MSVIHLTPHDRDGIVSLGQAATGAVRPGFAGQAKAFFSLSQTQRRLAHECRREAAIWKADGDAKRHSECMAEFARLWNESKWHLQQARSAWRRANS